MNDESAGLYAHIPYCVVRCSYCDFYSQTGEEEQFGPFFDALVADVAGFPRRAGSKPRLSSVFLGGGTPSYAPPEGIARLLETIRGAYALEEDAEITLEANPESLTAERVRAWRAAGVNRLSVGIQSLRPSLLALMGRPHGADEAMGALRTARREGIGNLSADFIFGLPGQTAEEWEEDLERIAELGLDHLSCYLLETDKPTPLAREVESGRLAEPEPESIARQFEATARILGAAGFGRYEISNFSRPGRECRHNLGYWTDRPFLGFGPSAHGYWKGARTAVRLSARDYIAAVAAGRETIEILEPFDAGRRAAEAIVTGLRMTAGIDLGLIGARYGLDLAPRHARAIEEESARGRLESDGARLRLTESGRLFSNDVLCRFV